MSQTDQQSSNKPQNKRGSGRGQPSGTNPLNPESSIYADAPVVPPAPQMPMIPPSAAPTPPQPPAQVPAYPTAYVIQPVQSAQIPSQQLAQPTQVVQEQPEQKIETPAPQAPAQPRLPMWRQYIAKKFSPKWYKAGAYEKSDRKTHYINHYAMGALKAYADINERPLKSILDEAISDFLLKHEAFLTEHADVVEEFERPHRDLFPD